MYVDVDEVAHEKLLSEKNTEELSAKIAERVVKARQRQASRLGGVKTNSALTNQEIKRSGLSMASQQLLNQAADQLQLSARNYMRTIKVARTIADLGDSETIETAHVAEALQYRRPVVKF